jgi:hypothetical protein
MGTTRDYDLVIDCSGFDRTPVAQYFDPKLVAPQKQKGAKVARVNKKAYGAPETKKRSKVSAPHRLPKLSYLSPAEVSDIKQRFANMGWSNAPQRFIKGAERIARVSFNQLAKLEGSDWLLVKYFSEDFVVVLSSHDKLAVHYREASYLTRRTERKVGTGIAGMLTETLRDETSTLAKLTRDRTEPRFLLFMKGDSLSPVQTAAERAESDWNRSGALTPEFGTINGERVEIAQKVPGQEVYVIGPETDLTFTKKERDKIQANFIAENIVAVFLYSGRITTLAEILAERGRIGEADADGRSQSRRPAARVAVPWRDTKYRADTSLFLEPSPVVGRLLGPTIDPQTVVEAFVRYAFRDRRPEDARRSLIFSARLDNGSEKPVLTFQTSSALPIPIDKDPVFVRACYLLFTRPPYRLNGEVNEFTITVPTRVRDKAPAEFAWNRAVYAPQPGTAPRVKGEEKRGSVLKGKAQGKRTMAT